MFSNYNAINNQNKSIANLKFGEKIPLLNSNNDLSRSRTYDCIAFMKTNEL